MLFTPSSALQYLLGLVLYTILFSSLFLALYPLPRYTPHPSQLSHSRLPPEKFLLCIHPYGPNNQIIGIRNAMIAAFLLNRTLVVQDVVVTHYLASKEAVNSSSSIEVVPGFAFRPKILTMDEFGERFRNQIVQGPGLAHKAGYWAFWNRMGKLVQTYNITLRITSKAELRPFQFSKETYEQLLLERGNFSDPFMFFAVFNPLRWETTGRTQETLDHSKYLASIRLKTSLIEQAQEAIRGKLSDCFVCIHFRPKPDIQDCFDRWGTDEEQNPRRCAKNLPTFSWMRSRLEMFNAKCPQTEKPSVFAAVFPFMNQTVVGNLLQDFPALRIEDLFDLENLPGGVISFYEQAVCSLSTYYVWNQISTWDFNVHLDRYSRALEISPEYALQVWNRTSFY